MNATACLAQWVANTPDRWPPTAIAAAERAFADTIGCILAGVDEEAPRRVRDAIRNWGGGRASVIGTAMKVATPHAALANGTAAHSLDFDDVLEVAAAHVSAVLVPALLALGEDRGASGAALLDAYLVGFEVQARLAEAVNMEHYSRGWHTTLTLGTPAAAAACARLLHLDAQQTGAAISLSTSLASGSKRQFGTMAKPVHAGFAAQHGITAACFAETGVTAATECLEGAWGFQDLFAGDLAPGFASALNRLGSPCAIVEHGVWIKAYPCCASAHHAIDAVLDLRAEHGFGGDAIESVEVTVSEIAARNLMYPVPTSPDEARFSMNHCLAAAIQDGSVTLETFASAAILRPELRALAAKVNLRGDATMAVTAAARDRADRAEVLIRLMNGDILRRIVRYPQGHPGAPLGSGAFAAKFRQCVQTVLSEDSADRMLSTVLDLRSVHCVSDFMSALCPDSVANPRN